MAYMKSSSSIAINSVLGPSGVVGGTDTTLANLQNQLGLGNVAAGSVWNIVDGDANSLDVQNKSWPSNNPVIVRGKTARGARIKSLRFYNSSGLTIQNLKMWPDDTGSMLTDAVVGTNGSTSYLILDGVDIRSRTDSPQYATWTHLQLLQRAKSAGYFYGHHCTIRNSRMTGVNEGFELGGGGNNLAENIYGLGFRGDGCRLNASDIIYRNSALADFFEVDNDQDGDIDDNDNHLDIMQSFGGPRSNITCQNLILVESLRDRSVNPTVSQYNAGLAPAASSLPPVGRAQGLAMFNDGTRSNTIISDVDLICSAPQGLALYNTTGVSVLNVRVVNGLDSISGGVPWMTFDNSTGVAVSGSTAVNFSGYGAGNTQITSLAQLQAVRAEIMARYNAFTPPFALT